MNLIMSFVLACEIFVIKPTATVRFTMVNDVEIRKSWRSLGDTAAIKLFALGKRVEDAMAVGDKVTIDLWYKGFEKHREFEGIISRIKPTIPFELECEDNVWYMKRTPVKNTWKKTTLKEVVRYLVDQTNAKYPQAALKLHSNIPDVTFSEKGFIIESDNTAATALQKINDNYGLVSYFKGNELFVGLSEGNSFGRVKHSLQYNVIESDLTYRKAEDVKIRIKPVGFTKDNKKIEPQDAGKKDIVVGDADGELRTAFYYGVSTASELLALAKKDLLKYRYEGFEGTMLTFLYPYAEPLFICELQDPKYNNARSGNYQIDSVITTFGVGGGRREIELGNKVSV